MAGKCFSIDFTVLDVKYFESHPTAVITSIRKYNRGYNHIQENDFVSPHKKLGCTLRFADSWAAKVVVLKSLAFTLITARAKEGEVRIMVLLEKFSCKPMSSTTFSNL